MFPPFSAVKILPKYDDDGGIAAARPGRPRPMVRPSWPSLPSALPFISQGDRWPPFPPGPPKPPRSVLKPEGRSICGGTELWPLGRPKSNGGAWPPLLVPGEEDSASACAGRGDDACESLRSIRRSISTSVRSSLRLEGKKSSPSPVPSSSSLSSLKAVRSSSSARRRLLLRHREALPLLPPPSPSPPRPAPAAAAYEAGPANWLGGR